MKALLLIFAILLFSYSCSHLTPENSADVVRSVLKARMRSFHECSRKTSVALSGMTEISFIILPNGTTSQIEVVQDEDDKNLEQRDLDCIAELISRITFPTFNADDFPDKRIDVNFPLQFISRDY